jgi:hypothetical protein
MKLGLTLAFAVLTSHISTIFVVATPAPTASPTVLLPPAKFSIKIVRPANHGIQSLGYISLPSSPTQGSLVHIGSTASPFYFKQKIADGQGIVFSSPDFFTPSSFALSYNTNHTLPQSKVYLSNLLDNEAGGLILIDMEAARMGFDSKNLYLKGVGNGLGGTPQFAPVVFSFDEERAELWVSTKGELDFSNFTL